MNKKGFSFSFDAFIAAVVIIGTLAFIAANTAQGFEFASQKIVQKQLADDLLTQSVDLNILQQTGSDAGKINGFMQANLPPSEDYQMQITVYTLSAEVFSPQSTTLYGNTTIDLNTVNYTESKKVFATYDTNYNIQKYGSATLKIWVK
jgi:hypothetical protein